MIREVSHSHEGSEVTPPTLPTEVATYRKLYAAAREAVQNVDGSEQTYRDLWKALIPFDEYVQSQYPRTMPRLVFEQLFAAAAGILSPDDATIGALLVEAAEIYKKKLDGGGAGLGNTVASLRNTGILVKNSAHVLIETNSDLQIPLSRDGNWQSAEYSPRLRILIAGLQQYGIHKEDLILTIGSLRENMLRTEPYVLVEIPRLGREVLVCNQVGQITFVSDQARGILSYADVDKETLKATPGIFTVRFHSEAQWLADIVGHLTDAQPAETHKINVREFSELREAILSQPGMTAEAWAGMTKGEKKLYRVPDTTFGLAALASKFGVDGDPIRKHKFHLELGMKIFGEKEVFTKKLEEILAEDQSAALSLVQLREKIKGAPGMTAEVWAAMTLAEKSIYRAPDTTLGLWALASKFAVEGRPIQVRKVHLQLGRQIFGEQEVFTKKLEEIVASEQSAALSPVQLRQKIQGAPGMTAEVWAGMTTGEKKLYRVPDTRLGLNALASRFEVEGNPIDVHKFHLELGKKIFGEQEVFTNKLEAIIAHEKSVALSTAQLSEKIKRAPGMSPEAWAGMTQQEKSHFRAPGTELGLNAIGSRFEVAGSPIGSHKFHLELGKKIFGEQEVFAKKLEVIVAHEQDASLSTAQLSAKIKGAPGMSAGVWAGMKQREKCLYRAPDTGLGLIALASRFEVAGNPISFHKFHLELGKKIFGEAERA